MLSLHTHAREKQRRLEIAAEVVFCFGGMMKTGDYFIHSSGDYTDYCVHDLFRCLADFDEEAVSQAYTQSLAEGHHYERFNFAFFITKVLGLAERVEFKEIHEPFDDRLFFKLAKDDMVEMLRDVGPLRKGNHYWIAQENEWTWVIQDFDGEMVWFAKEYAVRLSEV